jgi:hypothetical protein
MVSVSAKKSQKKISCLCTFKKDPVLRIQASMRIQIRTTLFTLMWDPDPTFYGDADTDPDPASHQSDETAAMCLQTLHPTILSLPPH